ncbi:LOW QUALITY PROTEIN: hypothetical protein ACHAWF_013637 [Thalassiosira exigua]
MAVGDVVLGIALLADHAIEGQSGCPVNDLSEQLVGAIVLIYSGPERNDVARAFQGNLRRSGEAEIPNVDIPHWSRSEQS